MQFSSFLNEGKHDLRDPVAHQQANHVAENARQGIRETYWSWQHILTIVCRARSYQPKDYARLRLCNIREDGYYKDMHEGSGLSPREIGPPLPQSLGF